MKLLITLILLMLAVGRIDATSPNTGQLPESCVKIEFSGKQITSVEPASWELLTSNEEAVLTKGLVMIKLTNFIFKDDEEIIGFTWETKHAGASLTVKHGTTVLAYGTEFITTDRKGISNAVWCVTETAEEPEPEEPPVDEEPEEEPPVEEEPQEEPEIEEPVDEAPDDEEEIFVPIDEDDTEPLPETNDVGISSLSLLVVFLLGAMMIIKAKL